MVFSRFEALGLYGFLVFSRIEALGLFVALGLYLKALGLRWAALGAYLGVSVVDFHAGR